ncbi:MAG: hypothetical protein HY320_06105, partial [Armatimonadetes bacterium]|nr:hypothetical protein [Armatimonadota bacterium]
DLQQVVARTLADRQREVEKVERIVEEEVDRFEAWLRGREVAPTIGVLQQRAERIVAEEVERLGGKLSHLAEREREIVHLLARAVARKLMHEPITRLRAAAASGDGREEVEAVRRVFGLDAVTSTPEEDQHPNQEGAAISRTKNGGTKDEGTGDEGMMDQGLNQPHPRKEAARAAGYGPDASPPASEEAL